MSTESTPTRHLDARTFQYKLAELATTVALKVQREGPQHGLKPGYVTPDIYFLLRQSQQTYSVFFFMNADERRQKDCDWRVAYSAVILPLIRTMIDCLYNITAILQNPGLKGYEFRASGYRLVLQALDDDQTRYGGDPKWDDWVARQRKHIEFDMRTNGFTEAEVRTARIWPTLTGYLRVKNNSPLTPHQEFLKKLTLGFWQEYSGISHATFQGLLAIALFLEPRDLPHEDRPAVEDASEVMITIHIARVAGILLCTLTEVQAYCRFDGARINERLHEIWNALVLMPEIKELYDERYSQLMMERGINPE
ncbi:MAG: hypothetical protein ABSG77_16035 [Candidatus Acidiferrum sp.]|jgi:hypothetical protein